MPVGLLLVVTINTPPELLKYIIKKGSIAIDGISLTVTQVTESSFSVSLIPHTATETTLGLKDVGDSVNLETDIIGKYVEKLLCKGQSEGITEEMTGAQTIKENALHKSGENKPDGITRDILAKYGF